LTTHPDPNQQPDRELSDWERAIELAKRLRGRKPDREDEFE
jgi:hypothetical protein